MGNQRLRERSYPQFISAGCLMRWRQIERTESRPFYQAIVLEAPLAFPVRKAEKATERQKHRELIGVQKGRI